MLNYFDVIKAQSGVPVDDIWAQLWGNTMSTEYVITTYTGTLPATLQTVEGHLENYKIYGNTEQSGTPTPSSPIYPSECGERTENLAWTGWAQDFVTRINSSPIASIESIDNRNCLFFVVSAGYDNYDTKYIFSTDWKANTQYTISFEGLRLTTESTSNIMQVWYTDGSNELFPKSINSGNFESYTKTTAAGKTVKYIAALYTSDNFRIDIDTFMLNEGSTALPYEPYGYKLPLTANGVEYPIYLGEAETTRRIKKIKARDITWNDGTSAGYSFYRGTLPIAKIAGLGTDTLISNKYKSSTTRNNMSDCEIASYNATTTRDIVVRDDRYSSASDWLLANGDTEIYYVLATEETGTLNEPLRKIGDYADTIDSTQSTVQIPTATGETTISWAGEGLAPSEVELTYKTRKGDEA